MCGVHQDCTFNGITGPSLTSFETRDIFKSTGLNGDSFVDEVEAKCESSSIIQQEAAAANGGAAPYSNEPLHSTYIFNKPTLDLENMGMAYGISGLYLQGNGITGLGSPSSPSMSQSGLLSPSMVASEKLNGLTLGQQMAPSYGMQPFSSSARAMSLTAGTKLPFVSSSSTSPVTQVVPSQQQQPAANGMTRFGSQEILMAAAESNGLSQSSSPVLSPNSSDGKEQVERLIGSENGMKMAQEQKQYYSIHQLGVMQPERGVDSSANFVDQVLFFELDFLTVFYECLCSFCDMCFFNVSFVTCARWSQGLEIRRPHQALVVCTLLEIFSQFASAMNACVHFGIVVTCVSLVTRL